MPFIEYIRPVGTEVTIRVVTGDTNPYRSWQDAVDAAVAFMREAEAPDSIPRWAKISTGLTRLIAPDLYISATVPAVQREADLTVLAADPESIPPVSYFSVNTTA